MGNPILGERVREVAASEGGRFTPRRRCARIGVCMWVYVRACAGAHTNVGAHSHASERKG